MKILGLLAVLLTATTASAASSIVYESVTFRESAMWVPADKTCVRGGYIYHKTRTTLPVCVDVNSSQCEMVEKAIIPQPVIDPNFVRYEGGNDEGAGEYPVTYTVDQSTRKIFEVRSNNSGSDVQKVIGTYTIPACRTADDIDAL